MLTLINVIVEFIKMPDCDSPRSPSRIAYHDHVHDQDVVTADGVVLDVDGDAGGGFKYPSMSGSFLDG